MKNNKIKIQFENLPLMERCVKTEEEFDEMVSTARYKLFGK